MAADARRFESRGSRGTKDELKGAKERARFVGSFSGYEENALFIGLGDRYEDSAAYPLGLQSLEDGRAVAPFDMDGDGDLDLAILSLQGLRLYANAYAGDAKWLRLSLKDTRGAAPLGAVVRVRTERGTQVRRVEVTTGFHTQISTDLHFGLGASSAALAVEIEWPSGRRQQFENLSGALELREGGKPLRRPYPRWAAEHREAMRKPFRMPQSTTRLDGAGLPIGGGDRPLIVNFWAPWCEACKRELPLLGKLYEANMEQMDFAGVCVDVSDIKAAERFARQLGAGFNHFRGDRDVLESFFGDSGEISLPATFVFDQNFELRRVFYREIREDDIAKSLALRDMGSEDYRGLAFGAFRQGQGDDALNALKEAVRADLENGANWWRLGVFFLGVQEWESALESLKKASTLAAEDPDVWMDLARAYGGLKQERKRLSTLRKAARLGSGRAHYALGRHWRSKGEDKKAKNAFQKALRLDPAPFIQWSREQEAKANAEAASPTRPGSPPSQGD